MTAVDLKISITAPLDHFDLSLDLSIRSPVTGIFAPSGAGKTSLIKCLAGLQRHISGYIAFNHTVWLDSQRKIHRPPETRGIGYVPQEGLLFPNKNVRQNLLIGTKRAHQHSDGAPSRRPKPESLSLQSVCNLLELSPLLQRAVKTLSGGERQRVALGRAICSNPGLLLLDEPLASLDIQLRRKILPFLRRIREELQIPMILISHNPTEIQALCDEVLVLHKGKKRLFGPCDQVMLSPDVLLDTQDDAAADSFQNMLPAVLQPDQPATQTHLTLGETIGDHTNAPTLVTNKISAQNPHALLVGIPAKDIILAKYKPEAISAQNILAATVTLVQSVGNCCMVTTTLANGEGNPAVNLTVELSAQGWHSLDLHCDDQVYLVIKAANCIIYY